MSTPLRIDNILTLIIPFHKCKGLYILNIYSVYYISLFLVLFKNLFSFLTPFNKAIFLIFRKSFYKLKTILSATVLPKSKISAKQEAMEKAYI